MPLLPQVEPGCAPSASAQTSLAQCLPSLGALQFSKGLHSPPQAQHGRAIVSGGAVLGVCLVVFPSVRWAEVFCLSWGLWLQTEARHCLLSQKAESLACLPPCQLKALPGGSTPSDQLSLEASCMSAGTSPGLMVSVVPF